MIYTLDLLTSINGLFVTEGIISYLVLLVLVILVLVVAKLGAVAGFIGSAVGLIIGLYYLNLGLGWHFIVMILSSVGVMFMLAKESVKK